MNGPDLIRLSAIEPADATALERLFTDPRVREFLGGPIDAAIATRRVTELFDRPGDRPAWVIRSVSDGIALGIVLLDDHHDGKDVEISCLVLPEHQRRGYGIRAVRKGLRFGFERLGLRRIIAETQSTNVASTRLLERVGMFLERRVRRFGAEQSIHAVERNSHSPEQPAVR